MACPGAATRGARDAAAGTPTAAGRAVWAAAALFWLREALRFFGIPALLSQLCFGSLASAQSLSYTGATGVARTPLRHVRCLLGLFAR
jgi:hypothetical protein